MLDILKYQIGYCEKGRYANKIIIPTYNADGVLDYFVARSFEKEPSRKYDAPSSDKNIIGFGASISCITLKRNKKNSSWSLLPTVVLLN